MKITREFRPGDRYAYFAQLTAACDRAESASPQLRQAAFHLFVIVTSSAEALRDDHVAEHRLRWAQPAGPAFDLEEQDPAAG